MFFQSVQAPLVPTRKRTSNRLPVVVPVRAQLTVNGAPVGALANTGRTLTTPSMPPPPAEPCKVQ